MNKSSGTDKTGKKITSKQVVAIIGILLLILMYLATLITAIVDSSASGRLFWICLYATVAVPLLVWIYTWMYGKLTGKRTLADFEPGGKNEQPDNPASAAESDTKQD